MIEMQQKIRFRDHDINVLQKKNLALKQEISDHLLAQQALKEKITQLENIIKDNERDKAKMNSYHSNIQHDLQKEIETLQVNSRFVFGRQGKKD
jgi:chromosome segregation ATPase